MVCTLHSWPVPGRVPLCRAAPHHVVSRRAVPCCVALQPVTLCCAVVRVVVCRTVLPPCCAVPYRVCCAVCAVLCCVAKLHCVYCAVLSGVFPFSYVASGLVVLVIGMPCWLLLVSITQRNVGFKIILIAVLNA